MSEMTRVLRLAKCNVLVMIVLSSLLVSQVSPLPNGPAPNGSGSCPQTRRLLVNISGSTPASTVTLQLTESTRDFLYSPPRGVCFYQGGVVGDRDAIVVAKQRDSLFSATFQHKDGVYQIAEQSANKDHYLAVLIPPAKEPKRCGVSGTTLNPAAQGGKKPDAHFRKPRSALLDSNSDVSPVNKKYIKLILVGDQYFYERRCGSNMTVAISRLWEIGNYVNAFYKQFGVNIVVVHAEVWTKDPYITPSATSALGAKSKEMLRLFMEYKMRNFSHIVHSSAQLVSGLTMTGSDVGLAYLGRLCHFAQGGGVNSDRESNSLGVAATVAHELGHNLGLNHDEDEPRCNCPDRQGCIMAAVRNEVNPVRFSNCSVFRFNDFTVANGLGYCLGDPPEVAHLAKVQATCGNRIVERGEDCDCGLPQWCNNSCCNPATCKFTSGSFCASGQCCNLTTCSLKPLGVVCRPSRRNCDLDEYCNGTSEWCPQLDDYMADGSECSSGAYCYRGQCQDRNSRCSALFNGTDYRAAPEAYSVATIQGTALGYCGYTHFFNNNASDYSYNYTECSFENQRCGTLYCISASTKDNIPVWKGSIISDGKTFEGTLNDTTVTAGYLQLDLRSSGYRDPGMVPNGAECGTGRMCMDSVCVPANITAGLCPNCNRNGRCARSGQCFCNPGFKPPDCLQTGSGGSLTNHPADTTVTSTTSTSTTTPTTTTTKIITPTTTKT